eukprot:CAMPEP_0177532210 /NCGR_PEP_ID=MMETSP0369-20130122/54503_1 /TAXON_ID=447022 ORGANISM="Scrippsiella hangoei-like, Strain SHHI-4" /NCGR_SAMPLE_ID=MMETSP0369 /ASSEMBLY_ACC=CAM_ASM_000364 /LENGTH=102 /DNA_ID=CAMNT_0019013501 /DNA_START=145 /DNA_END=454 /DNA_ORIENTATION=+
MMLGKFLIIAVVLTSDRREHERSSPQGPCDLGNSLGGRLVGRQDKHCKHTQGLEAYPRRGHPANTSPPVKLPDPSHNPRSASKGAPNAGPRSPGHTLACRRK